MTTSTDSFARPTYRDGPTAWSRLRNFLFGLLLTIIAVVALGTAFLIGLSRAHDGRIVPGVSVAHVPLAGLDRAAAEGRLRQDLPPLAAGKATIVLGSSSTSIDYSRFGRDYDLQAMLDQAFAVGRSGRPLADSVDQVGSLIRHTEIAPAMHYDRAAVDREIQRVVASFAITPVDATVTFDPTGGAFRVTPSRDGRSVDPAPIAQAVASSVDSLSVNDVRVEATATSIAPRLTTAQAQAQAQLASDTVRALTANPVRLTLGTQTFTVDAAAVRRWVRVERQADGTYQAALVPTIMATDVATYAPAVAVDPKPAGFAFTQSTADGGGTVVGVTPSTDGRAIDVKATVDRIRQALAVQHVGSPPVQLAMATISVPPTLTTAEAQAVAPRMTVVSTWKTKYFVTKNNCNGANIKIPTSTINSYVLAAGQQFDFWNAIGGISEAKGYCPGAFIGGGRTIHPGDIGPDGKPEEGALGGGICSCSTTLFNAALRLGLEMGARRNHYYYIDRYPLGLDATVFQSGNSVTTMQFTNDTQYPILIRGINSQKNGIAYVRFDLYSVPNGRTVRIDTGPRVNPTLAQDSIHFSTDVRQVQPGHPHRLEIPTDGFDVTVMRTVTDAAGNVIHRDTYKSKYGRITGQLLVYGIGADILFPPGVRADPTKIPIVPPPPANTLTP